MTTPSHSGIRILPVVLTAVLWLSPAPSAAQCVDYADPLAAPDFVEFDLAPDGEIADMVVVGNTLWMARTFYGAMVSADITDIDAPVLLASEPVEIMNECYDIAVSGDRGFLTYFNWGGVAGVRIFDLSDRNDPVDIGDVPAPSGRWASYVAARDSLIYVSFSYTDFAIVDVSDPAAPVTLGELLIDHPWEIVLDGDYAYVITETQPVIVDISDPTAPATVATLPTTTPGNELTVSAGVAYVATDSGFECFDVSDPTAPTALASLATPAVAVSVSVRDGLAYVGLRDVGVHVYDVSDPAVPIPVSVIDTPGLPWNQTLHDERLLLITDYKLFVVPYQCAPTTAVVPRPVLRLDASPNPFNPSTRIDFELPVASRATLAVHDLAGRRHRTLLDGAHLTAGPHDVVWDGRDAAGRALPSGVYVFRLEAGRHTETRRVVLAR